jgi:hypothetical protein
VVSFGSIERPWESVGVEYLVLEGSGGLDAAKIIAHRALKHPDKTILVTCSHLEKAIKVLLLISCLLVLRFKWTMTVAAEFVRSAVQVEGSIFSEENAS